MTTFAARLRKLSISKLPYFSILNLPSLAAFVSLEVRMHPLQRAQGPLLAGALRDWSQNTEVGLRPRMEPIVPIQREDQLLAASAATCPASSVTKVFRLVISSSSE